VTLHRFKPCDDWTVWLPVKVAEGAKPSLEPGTVGALTGANGTTAVTYEGETKKLTKTASLIGLHLQDVGAGTYDGKIDLTPNDKETGNVTLELTVSHWWPLPAPDPARRHLARPPDAALRRLLGNAWAAVQARRRHPDPPERRAQGPRRGRSRVEGDDLANLCALQSGLRQEIDDRTKSHTTIQIDKKVVDDLDGKIDELVKKVATITALAAALNGFSPLDAFRQAFGTHPR
jgi:hypothetical protein